VLGVADDTHEAVILAGVLAHVDSDDRTAVGVVSEDARLRTLAEGFGASASRSSAPPKLKSGRCVGSGMSRETADDQYVACPAPACNFKGRRSTVKTHLADRNDQRHERFDGSEL